MSQTANTEFSNESCVTGWLTQLRVGDEIAATRLWEYLQPRLVEFGRRRIQAADSACYDEDDVAQSAFHALCSAMQAGKYEDVADRGELWQLLATIALNKVRKRIVYSSAKRRGGGATSLGTGPLEGIESGEWSAEQRAVMQEECERLLSVLQRDEVKQVALLRIEGHTNEEIAELLGCTRRSVQRRLEFIRSVWSQDLLKL